MRRQLLPNLLVAGGVLVSIGAAVLFAKGDYLGAAALLLSGQILFALRLVYHRRNGLLIGDIRLSFIVFYALYSGTSAWLVLLPTEKFAYPGLAEATLLGALGQMGFNAALFCVRHREFPLDTRLPGQRIRPTMLPPVALAVGLFLTVAYGDRIGIDMSIGPIDRARSSNAIIDQTWVVLRLVLVGVCNYALLSWRRMGATSRSITAVLLAAYVLLHVMQGNRRDILPLLLTVACLYGLRHRSRVNMWNMSVAAAITAAFLLLGVARLHLAGPTAEVIIAENEFTVPIQITAFYTQAPTTLLFGESYVRLVSYLVPRSLWPEKPVSLSIQFLRDCFGRSNFQGFAYNPVAEGFINFGWIGPLLVMAGFGLLLSWLVHASARHHILYLCCYSMVGDFQRGEFALMAYQLLFVYGTLLGLTKLEVFLPSIAPADRLGAMRRGSLDRNRLCAFNEVHSDRYHLGR